MEMRKKMCERKEIVTNIMEHDISYLVKFGLHALSILSFAGYVVILDVFGNCGEDGNLETTLALVVGPMLVNILHHHIDFNVLPFDSHTEIGLRHEGCLDDFELSKD